jgi:predicted TIM-barrel fold metal-dependent hydrolase
LTANTIIDTDTHVTEPADLWTSRVASKWGDLVPHVKWNDDRKMEMWYVGEEPIASAAGSAAVGWNEPFPSAPPTFADAHPGAFDARERLKVMDASGVLMEVLYPNLGGIAFHIFLRLGAPELRLEATRAYNDFLLDWVSVAPDRFIPLACIPYWDVEESVKEIERCAPLGHKGIVTTGAPQGHGLPYLGDASWEPIWAAAEAHNLPVSFHAGNGDIGDNLSPGRLTTDGAATTYARAATSIFFDNSQQLTDLLLCGVLPRHPGLKFISVESGIGWIPFCLESCDYHFLKGGVRRERPWFEDLPSDYFRRQVYANYWFERLEDWMVERVGVNNILFETDFPHPTCLYGDEVERVIASGLSGQPADVQERILWRNAADLFDVDVVAAST